MQQGTITLIVAAVGIAGTLGGVVIGQRMTRSWQRDQWILDNKKHEYRELISALSTAHVYMLRFGSGADWPDEIHKRVEAVKTESFSVIRDRIFIAHELAKADIAQKWGEAFYGFVEDSDVKKFVERFTQLREAIVEMALNDTEKA